MIGKSTISTGPFSSSQTVFRLPGRVLSNNQMAQKNWQPKDTKGPVEHTIQLELRSFTIPNLTNSSGKFLNYGTPLKMPGRVLTTIRKMCQLKSSY